MTRKASSESGSSLKISVAGKAAVRAGRRLFWRAEAAVYAGEEMARRARLTVWGFLVRKGRMGREGRGERTAEHVFALAVEDAGSGLEVLAAEPFCERDGSWVGGAGVDGDLLAGLSLGLLSAAASGLLGGELLLLALVVLEGFLLELGDVLLEGEAGLFGVGFELGALGGLELLWCHAALLRFDGHLLLHGGDLLRGGLLPWYGWWDGHDGVYGCREGFWL